MKSKFSLFLATVLILGLGACTKSSNSSTPDNNPNITISGKSTDLLGVSKAFYQSPLNNDSIIIVNSSATSSSFLAQLSNLSGIPSSINYLALGIYTNNTISQTTYSRGGSTAIVANLQVNGQHYGAVSILPCTVTIDTLNTIFVSGSYSITAVNLTNALDFSNPTLTGRFRAVF